MSANDFLGLIIQLFFIILGAITAADYIRHKGRIRRDIALMFGSLAALFLLQDIGRITGVQSRWIGILAINALLAQPYLILRLVPYFRPVSPMLMRIAGISMVLFWLVIAVAESLSQILIIVALIALITYFAAIEGYAMISFVRGAVSTSGVVRQRLRFAAAGSGLLATALVSLGLTSLIPVLRDVFTSLTLLTATASGLCYYIGFAPPRWLRRAWQFVELRNFLLQISTKSIGARLNLTESLDDLCQATNRAVGGVMAAVAEVDGTANRWRLRHSTNGFKQVEQDQIETSILLEASRERKPLVTGISENLSESDHTLLETIGADTLLIAPIVTLERDFGLLLVFRKQGSLFIEDDLELVQLFAQQSAIFLENGILIEELQGYSEQLEKRVNERTLELQNSREEYRRIVETAQEGIWVTDAEHKTTFVNARLAEMLGYTVEEFMTKPALAFLDEEGQAAAMRNRERRQQGIKEQYEFKFRRKDGHEVWTLISTTPLMDDQGQFVGALAMIADITKRKLAEDHILKMNAELEQRVAERTLQLETMNKELEAFSYSVSHDLRAPLRSIDGFSQALLEDFADQLNEDGLSYLKRVRAATKRMAELIDDLLNLARFTRAQIRRETVDLSLLSQSIAESLQKTQPERQVKFVIQQNLVANADPQLLKIVLENLLGNAWKFTGLKSDACIEVNMIVQDSQPVFFVRDDGAGFDMTYVDKLFGAFQRLHGANEFDGTGIGLATVQRIIHRHGGRVWAEGAVGKGATFYFAL